ncbi:hypothetical protein L0222_06330 [bacterium]|nr:hypothetical protein [bacterium]MCI0602776.1 hypothetical protein [bacterium]
MKKSLCIALMLIVGSFWACKKAEEKKPVEEKQITSTKQTAKQKRKKRAKAAVQTLQIYQEEKLIISIPRDEYTKIAKTTIKVNGKEEKAILLSDLLKTHNVTGKNVILKGPNRTASLTWEQVTSNPIYLYPGRNRLQTYYESKALIAANVPVVVVRIEVSDKPVASETMKGTTKQ